MPHSSTGQRLSYPALNTESDSFLTGFPVRNLEDSLPGLTLTPPRYDVANEDDGGNDL
jgi:hypothetical protein